MAYTTINKGSSYFNTLLYTATGVQSLTGLGFQPDMSWVKSRSTTSSHNIEDAVRGSTKTIKSDSAAAEVTQDLITSFDSDGVTLGTSNWSDSRTAVIWNWKANGAGSSNTDGSITSTVSANTTSGFSIVSYTGNATGGATIGHGLGVTPKMIIIKNLSTTEDWRVYHIGVGNTNALVLNSTSTPTGGTGMWNNTSPNSSVFSVGTHPGVNGSGNNLIAYCFADVKGFSKFGSYTGNGSADGTFVYTGFKPAFVLVKNYTDASQSWHIWNNKASPSNAVQKYLLPDTSDAEGDASSRAIDFLSNGFKPRGTSLAYNSSGSGFIYMAFAEHPLVSSTGTPVTAR